jgi:hypothetical protein
MMVRFSRAATGLRKALAVFQRMPRFWLTSKYAQPALSPLLKSSVLRIPTWSAA